MIGPSGVDPSVTALLLIGGGSAGALSEPDGVLSVSPVSGQRDGRHKGRQDGTEQPVSHPVSPSAEGAGRL